MWVRRTTPVFKGGTFHLQFSQLGFQPTDWHISLFVCQVRYLLFFTIFSSVWVSSCNLGRRDEFRHETRTRSVWKVFMNWRKLFIERSFSYSQTRSGIIMDIITIGCRPVMHAIKVSTEKTISRYLRKINIYNGQEIVSNRESGMYSQVLMFLFLQAV